MSISVIFVVKNAINLGYCFWESLQSCLPFADEIIISEGYSKDSTKEYLDKFKAKYGSILPITIFQEEWPERSYVGEAISIVTENAIKRANCDWVLNLQADEIYHEDVGDSIKKIATSSQYNSACFPFYHFIESWSPYKNPAYETAIRMVRRGKNVKIKGDGWTFLQIDPVYPSNFISKPIYHFAWCFPKNNEIKHISHADIYENIPEYQEKMRKSYNNLYKEKDAYPLDPNFNDFPQLARRFVGKVKYELPEDI